MLDIIQLLPDSIANQIAAGEVVQRPASVVKELLENSIDAGSQNVQLIVKEAGKTLIQVTDDGIGMSETDARMCFERHATSKIRATEDLFAIQTKGFRGEALASIAAIARVELKSRTEAEELGTQIIIEGSTLKTQEAVACPKGTTFLVKNLFYNVPARRNFLKSNAVEMRHIIEEFQRVSLAHPDINFSLYHNDQEVYNLPKGKLSHRIVGIFGKNYKEQLASCAEETPHVSVEGFIGKPQQAKKTRGEQFFFVNNRFIKNSYLHHAVMNAFEGLLPENTFPFYILFITIDPRHIDINVHPTKTEIKFEDERTIYAIVRAAVKQALGVHNLMPSLDFDQDVNFQSIEISSLDFEGAGLESHSYAPNPKEQSSSNDSYERFKNPTLQQNNQNNWEQLFENNGTESDEFEFNPPLVPETEEQNIEIFESAANDLNSSNPFDEEYSEKEGKNNMAFQLHERYLVVQVKSGMMLIDQQAAHERILFEKHLASLENRTASSQQFLFPQYIELNPMDFELVKDLEEEIRALGFIYEVAANNTIIINGIPVDVIGGNEKELFEGLLEQYKQNCDVFSLSKKENIARAMARRSAIRPGYSLTNEEIQSLINQLFACSNPNYTPNGQPTFSILDLAKLAGLFN
ncbi:DNA mismatch repair endonuclease MutL [Xanthovirga aplysinae]|uniref:DNA mismatch repair endonuclease MutL n=1 Tax=Xanthovirga aplysinae TaxID=2529853 RepID=UPI0012BD439A|nr:DNA mismatch repair endonuclease MutL [Xanthovirga aplysinae]MTI30770.1 DNA mismatch repair endonuclease MutL [Xanthovirga aplysinae]